jgi:hypothetical protein
MKNCSRFRPRVEELEGRLAPASLAYSTNWSGYALSTGAGAVSRVAGSWVVPAVSSRVAGYSSAWVGIDGWNSGSVEQIGTDSDYVNGRFYYYAWYEMYPVGSVNLSLTINPGDTIDASVSYTGSSEFTMALTNVTTGNSFSITKTSAQAQRSSAEWIQEAPSSINGVLPLANFGKINFSGATANVSGTSGPADNGWAGSTLNQTNMVTRTGSLKATTSALTDSGSPAASSFSVTSVSSGASGKGSGRKSSNQPPPDSSQTTFALAVLAASRQETPAFVATQPLVLAVAPPAVFTPATVPGLNASISTSAPYVLEAFNPNGPAADQANPAGVPQNGPVVPADPQIVPQSNELPAPQTDQAPDNSSETSLETGRMVDPGLANGSWLSPAASLESTSGTLNQVQNVQHLALSALVLLFAADHTWTSGDAGTDCKRRWRLRSIGGRSRQSAM